MAERIVVFGPTVYTETSTSYVTILDYTLPDDIIGVSGMNISIVPSSLALYRLQIGDIVNLIDVKLPAIWELRLAHLTSGVYRNIKPGMRILIQHKSSDGSSIQTGLTGLIYEVVGEVSLPPGRKIELTQLLLGRGVR
jgi:hypothetical protein